MGKKIILISMISCLWLGQSSIAWAITNEEGTTEVQVKQKETSEIEEGDNTEVEAGTEDENSFLEEGNTEGENSFLEEGNTEDENSFLEEGNTEDENSSPEKDDVPPQEETTPEQQEKPVETITDKEAPVLHQLVVNKKEVKIGDVVTISANVTDASGVKSVSAVYRNSSVDGNYESMTGTEIQLTYNSKTGKYEGVFVVFDWVQSGVWDVLDVVVKDKVGNEKLILGADIQNDSTRFVVKGKELDLAPPTLHGVTVSKASVGLNESSMVSVNATDVSGVEEVIVTYLNLQTWVQRELNLEQNIKTGLWELEFFVDTYIPNGQWEIVDVELKDKAGNVTHITRKSGQASPFIGANITVSGASNDKSAPVLKDFQPRKNKGEAGDVISIDAYVEDESGVGSLTATYQNKETYQQKTIEFYGSELSKETDFVGEFDVTDETDNGTWELLYIELIDMVGNETQVGGSLYPKTTIVVNDAKSDVIPPIIHHVEITKTADPLQPGDVVSFSVDATDEDSGILSAEMVYQKPVSQLPEIIRLQYNQDTKRYEGSFHVKPYTEMGIWENIGLVVMDKAGNTASQTPVDGSNFTVTGTKLDKTPPTLVDVQVIGLKEVKTGEKVSVKVKAADDFSGVSRVGVMFAETSVLNTPTKAKSGILTDLMESLLKSFAEAFSDILSYTSLAYNESSGYYEGEVVVTKEMKRGDWVLSEVFLADEADNVNVVSTISNKIGFTIVNDKTTPPVIGGTDTPSNPTIPPSVSPETGDKSNVPLYGAGFLVSITGLGVIWRRRNKKS